MPPGLVFIRWVLRQEPLTGLVDSAARICAAKRTKIGHDTAIPDPACINISNTAEIGEEIW